MVFSGVHIFILKRYFYILYLQQKYLLAWHSLNSPLQRMTQTIKAARLCL